LSNQTDSEPKNVTLWQPTLESELLECIPLQSQHWNDLFAAASDPFIWEQHPESDRYKREIFATFFFHALSSNGALLVKHKETGKVVGSSRFVNHDAESRQVEIGYTFLIREFWGTDANRQLKNLMLKYAFEHVDTVIFRIGSKNIRSRKAIEKRGAVLVSSESQDTVVYALTKSYYETVGHLLP
jgi:RimJ/RimL family protein N-acetyltransferase